MKKIVMLCTSLCVVSINSISYADDTTIIQTQQPSTVNVQTQQPATVKVQTQQPGTAKVQTQQPATVKVEPVKQQQSSSFMDTIHSGWNKMIDSIAGMTRK